VIAYGITVLGNIRIILSTGFAYMGATQFNQTNWISTVTVVVRLTTQTFTVQAYNASNSSAYTFDSLIEILRIGG
jgi:hypothetical protein